MNDVLAGFLQVEKKWIERQNCEVGGVRVRENNRKWMKIDKDIREGDFNFNSDWTKKFSFLEKVGWLVGWF